jgi:hypothetical protein
LCHSFNEFFFQPFSLKPFSRSHIIDFIFGQDKGLWLRLGITKHLTTNFKPICSLKTLKGAAQLDLFVQQTNLLGCGSNNNDSHDKLVHFKIRVITLKGAAKLKLLVNKPNYKAVEVMIFTTYLQSIGEPLQKKLKNT